MHDCEEWRRRNGIGVLSPTHSYAPMPFDEVGLLRGRQGSAFGVVLLMISFFFFQAEDGIRDVAVTGVQTCALPIWNIHNRTFHSHPKCQSFYFIHRYLRVITQSTFVRTENIIMLHPIPLKNFNRADRKSTRLNSSHGYISYAVFCLKKKKTINHIKYVGFDRYSVIRSALACLADGLVPDFCTRFDRPTLLCWISLFRTLVAPYCIRC